MILFLLAITVLVFRVPIYNGILDGLIVWVRFKFMITERWINIKYYFIMKWLDFKLEFKKSMLEELKRIEDKKKTKVDII